MRHTEVVIYREGGDPNASRKSPGRTEYEPIILERGLTHDRSFEDWASKVWCLGAGLGAEVSLADFRKDIVIELYNEAGQLVMAFRVFRCWVSDYEVLRELNANGKASVAIESITLQNEGWERDISVVEPVEPTLDKK